MSAQGRPVLTDKRETVSVPGGPFASSGLRPFVPMLVLVAVFGVSRLLYHLAGVRFDMDTLSWFWQYVDPELLRTDLLRSLFYLHIQPPLMNLLLGLILKAFPGHEVAAFATIYLTAGLVLVLALYRLLIEVGVSVWLSMVLAGLFIIRPATVIYENWLFYPYLVMAALLLSGLFFVWFLRLGRTRDALYGFVLAAIVALTWTLFHLIWIVLLGVLLGLLRGRAWKRIVTAAAVPLVVVLFWYGKNLVLFGQFSTTSWLPMNVARVVYQGVPGAELENLVAEGKLSSVALVGTFSPLADYRDLIQRAPPTGIPVLDETLRTTGSPNFNNVNYLDLSRRYLRDDIRMLKLRPGSFCMGVLNNWVILFRPATAEPFTPDNLARIRLLDRAWNMVFNGNIVRYVYVPDVPAESPVSGLREGARRFPTRRVLKGTLIILGYIALLIWGIRLSRRRGPHHQVFLWAMSIFLFSSGIYVWETVGVHEVLKTGMFIILGYSVLLIWGILLFRRGPQHDMPQWTVFVFLLFNIAYILLVGDLMDRGENNRFRAVADPLAYVLWGWLLQQVWSKVRRRLARSDDR